MKKLRCALSGRSLVGWRPTALILAVLSIFALADSTFAQDDTADTTDTTTVRTILQFGTMIADPGSGTPADKAKKCDTRLYGSGFAVDHPLRSGLTQDRWLADSCCQRTRASQRHQPSPIFPGRTQLSGSCQLD
jgi:hypothetical protein